MSERGDAISVLFAFSDEHRGVGILQQFAQAIRDAAYVIEIPDVSAIAVWPALPEALRLEAEHLIKKLAVGGGVIVGRHDLAQLGLVRRLIERTAGHLRGGGDEVVGGPLAAAVSVWLESTKTCFVAHVVAADNWVVVSEAVNGEAVIAAELDCQATVVRAMARPRREHLAAFNFAAERCSNSLQAR